MGAYDRELVVGNSIEAGSLREDFTQLDVVFLATALLPGLQRVAVVDGAAPASVHALLDRLVVEELGPLSVRRTLKLSVNARRPQSISMLSSALATHSEVCAGSITMI